MRHCAVVSGAPEHPPGGARLRVAPCCNSMNVSQSRIQPVLKRGLVLQGLKTETGLRTELWFLRAEIRGAA